MGRHQGTGATAPPALPRARRGVGHARGAALAAVAAIVAVGVTWRVQGAPPKTTEEQIAVLEYRVAELEKAGYVTVAELKAIRALVAAPPKAPAAAPPPRPAGPPPAPARDVAMEQAVLQKVARLIRFQKSIVTGLDAPSLATFNGLPWKGSTSLLWICNFAATQSVKSYGHIHDWSPTWREFADLMEAGQFDAAVELEAKFLKRYSRKGKIYNATAYVCDWGG